MFVKIDIIPILKKREILRPGPNLRDIGKELFKTCT